MNDQTQWRNTLQVSNGKISLRVLSFVFDNVNDVLPVCCDHFTSIELHEVLHKLKAGKTSGADGNYCLTQRSIPEFWKVIKVILLFKKGDSTLSQNYRPISLLPVGYKVLAALIHQRLIMGGVDGKITASQFGFRPKRNCMEALMVVRRMIDAANEDKHHGLLVVFLDWAKAFDRIRVGGVVSALKRF